MEVIVLALFFVFAILALGAGEEFIRLWDLIQERRNKKRLTEGTTKNVKQSGRRIQERGLTMPHEFSARKFLGPIYPMTDQQESLVNHILEECEKQGLTINDLSAIAVFLKEAANRASHHTKFNRFGNCQY